MILWDTELWLPIRSLSLIVALWYANGGHEIDVGRLSQTLKKLIQ